MSVRIKRNSDVEAGLFFTAFGAVTSILSLDYELGTIAMMGPGMFPLMLGLCLTALGLLILLKGILTGGEAVRTLPLKPALLVPLSLLVFSFLALSVGLAAAIPGLVFVSLLASSHFTVMRALALSAGLLVFCYVVFVQFLGIALPMIAF